PFSELSLLEQIMNAVREIPQELPTADQKWLVFSQAEEAQVTVLADQGVGGMRANQGLGHGMQGSPLLLMRLFSGTGLYVSFFPADKNPSKPITEEEGDWLLAIQGF